MRWRCSLVTSRIRAQALAKGEALFAIRVQRVWRQWRANHVAELSQRSGGGLGPKKASSCEATPPHGGKRLSLTKTERREQALDASLEAQEASLKAKGGQTPSLLQQAERWEVGQTASGGSGGSGTAPPPALQKRSSSVLSAGVARVLSLANPLPLLRKGTSMVGAALGGAKAKKKKKAGASKGAATTKVAPAKEKATPGVAAGAKGARTAKVAPA